jgi:hypothetical protein
MRFRRTKDEAAAQDGDAPLHADPGDDDHDTERPPADDTGGLSLKFSLRAGEPERPPDQPPTA